MKTQKCPNGHLSHVGQKVCPTCQYLFAFKVGENFQDYTVLEHRKIMDRHVYRVSKQDEEFVITERMELYDPNYRSALYEILEPILESYDIVLENFFYLTHANFPILFTAYQGEGLWEVAQHSLRNQLDQEGLLSQEQIESIHAFLVGLRQKLSEKQLVNPYYNSLLMGFHKEKVVFLDWEFCCPTKDHPMAPTTYLGYHNHVFDIKNEALSFNEQLELSAFYSIMGEVIVSKPPSFWYPEGIKVETYRTILTKLGLHFFEDVFPTKGKHKLPKKIYQDNDTVKKYKAACQSFYEGYAAFQDKRFDVAFTCFQKSSENYLLCPQSFRFQALCLKDYRRFSELMQEAARLEKSANFYFEMAERLFVLREYSKAIEHLQEAVRLSFYYPEAYALLGHCFHKENNLPRAEKYYLQAWKQRKSNQHAEALHKLYTQLGLPQKSKEFQKYISIGGVQSAAVQVEQPNPYPTQHPALPQSAAPLEEGQDLKGYTLRERVKATEQNAQTKAVFLAEKDGKKYLIKQFGLPFTVHSQFLIEYTFLDQISHSCLQPFVERFIEQGSGFLVFEYLEGKTLLELLYQNQGIPEPLAWKVLISMASVLYMMAQHPSQILHMDIKPGNILVGDTGDIYLLDLDSLMPMGFYPQSQRNLALTYPFTPPELNGVPEPYLTSPNYSLGVTLIYGLTGVFPELLLLEGDPFVRSWEKYLPHISPELKQILQKLIHPKPQKRLAFSGGLLREWLQKVQGLPFKEAPEKILRLRHALWALEPPCKDVQDLARKIQTLLNCETSAVTLYYAAYTCQKHGETAMAQEYAEHVIRIQSNYVKAYWLLADCHFQKGNYQKTIDTLKASLDYAPDEPLVYLQMARAQRELNDAKSAVAFYHKALRYESPDLSIHIELIHYYIQLGWNQAVLDNTYKIGKKATRSEKEVLHFCRGLALGQMGYLEDAIEEYQAVVQLNPQHFEARLNLGMTLCKQRKWFEAHEHLKSAYELNSNHKTLRYYLAQTELKNNAKFTALEHLKAIEDQLSHTEEKVDFYFLLGQVYTHLAQWDNALGAYQKIILWVTDQEEIYVNMANIYIYQDKSALAEKCLHKALKINPKSVVAQRHLEMLKAGVLSNKTAE